MSDNSRRNKCVQIVWKLPDARNQIRILLSCRPNKQCAICVFDGVSSKLLFLGQAPRKPCVKRVEIVL